MAHKIKFQASDFEGNKFIDHGDCAVARALKRTFPGSDDITVYTECCHMDGQRYAFRNITLNNPNLDYKNNSNYFGPDAFDIMRAWFKRSKETTASIEIYAI